MLRSNPQLFHYKTKKQKAAIAGGFCRCVDLMPSVIFIVITEVRFVVADWPEQALPEQPGKGCCSL